MKHYVLDIEANGLLDTVDTIWMIVLKPVDEDTFVVFSDQAEEGLPVKDFNQWADANCKGLIAHNGMRYDFEVLYRLLGWSPKETCKLYDTMIISKLNNFIRPATSRRHSLKMWGQHLGEYKDEYTAGFDAYNDEMLEYCKQDCVVTEKVYKTVMQEAMAQIGKFPNYKVALRTEHDLSALSAQQTRDGWQFDFAECKRLIQKISEEMEAVETAIEPHLIPRTVYIDPEPRTPLYKKDGTYTAASARMIGEFLGFQVVTEDALKASPPMEPGTEYQRSQIIPASLGNQDIVKDYLETLGWKPLEWNWKKINGQFIKMSPKFCDKSLERTNHPHADMVSEYYTLRSRRSVLQGFMEQADGDGRLRGDMQDMGAQSFRQTHKIIANLPSGRAKYGKEIRSLFGCPEDKVIISADGASYQIRLLAHYLKSEDYTDTVMNGDSHQRHADAMGISRDLAKPVFFSVLFGAGAGKVGNILGTSQADGKDKRQRLLNGIPGMNDLLYKVQNFTKQHGYLPGIDGRKVFPESDYKALNYLIQSCEACLMKRTVVRIAEGFKEAGIDAKQLLFYHDECSWEIPKGREEEADKIIRHWFAEAPKEYGVMLMEAGDVKVGNNYYEVH